MCFFFSYENTFTQEIRTSLYLHRDQRNWLRTIGNVDQLLALLYAYAFKIFIYIEYSKTHHFV